MIINCIHSEFGMKTFRISKLQKQILERLFVMESYENKYFPKEEIILQIFGPNAFEKPKNFDKPNIYAHQNKIIRKYGKLKTSIKNSFNRSLKTLYENGFVNRNISGRYLSLFYEERMNRNGFRYTWKLTQKGKEYVCKKTTPAKNGISLRRPNE